MRGRPKLTDSRDNQYRVRLNDEENKMLSYASEKVDKPKSEIFRIALLEYYNNVLLNELYQSSEDEAEWEVDNISLKRVVKCPHCGTMNRIDLNDENSASTEDRPMGIGTLYEFSCEECCNICGKCFIVSGYISEYPAGALEHEKIDVSFLEGGE